MLEVSSAAKIVFSPLISVCANFGENKGLGFCEHGGLCLVFYEAFRNVIIALHQQMPVNLL